MIRPLRWFLIVAGLVVVLAGVVFWTAHRRAGETFEKSAQKVSEMIAAQRTRGGPRPTLGEAAAEGDAWLIYQAVLDQTSAIGGRDDEIAAWLDGLTSYYEEPTEEELEAWFVMTGKILDDLRPALRAPTLSASLPYEGGVAGPVKPIPAWQSLSRILSAHVKRHLERGEVNEALDLAVMRAFAGKDSMRNAGLIANLVGMGIVRVSTKEIEEILAERSIEPARLDRLAAELEVLRTDLPTMRMAWRVEEIYLRQTLADPAAWDSGFMSEDGVTPGPRFLFSMRLLAADALEGLSPHMAAMEAAVAGKRGKAAEAASQQKVDELARDHNELLRMIFAIHPMCARRDGELEMQLDLLRVAIAIARFRQARGAWPAGLDSLTPRYLSAVPDCAYSGEPFRYAAGKIWSIGGDGDDDGGKPLGEDDEITEDGDVVRVVHDPAVKKAPRVEEGRK